MLEKTVYPAVEMNPVSFPASLLFEFRKWIRHSGALKASFATDYWGVNGESQKWGRRSTHLGYLQLIFLPHSLLLLTISKMTINFMLMYFHFFLYFLPEKHPGIQKIKRSHNAASGRVHSVYQVSKILLSLLQALDNSFNRKRMHV